MPKIGKVTLVLIIIAVLVGAAVATFAVTTFQPQSYPESIKIGYLKVHSYLFPVFAAEKGFFDEEKLTVEAIAFDAESKLVDALKAGNVEFASLGTFMSVFPLSTQGSHLKMVHFGATFGTIGGQEVKLLDVIVKNELKDKVRSFKDLAGLKLGFSGRLLKYTLEQAMTKEGGDPSRVVWVEKPAPQLPPALASGEVDSIMAGGDSGIRALLGGRAYTLGDPYLLLFPKVTITLQGWFTSEDYLNRSPDVVKRFQRGVDRAVTYVKEHPEEWKQWVSKITNLPPEVVNVSFERLSTYLERYSKHPGMGKRGVEGFEAWTKFIRDSKLIAKDFDAVRIITLPWEDPWK